MPKSFRSFHRWAAVISALPVLITLATGVLLHLRKEISWVQPPQFSGASQTPTLPFDKILEITKTFPEAEVSQWKDISVIDVRPSQGVIRVRARNAYELQLDSVSGQVLGQGVRRTGVLISLHEGAWFGSWIRYGIFLPASILLLSLWITGVIIYIQPKLKRRRAGTPLALQKA